MAVSVLILLLKYKYMYFEVFMKHNAKQLHTIRDKSTPVLSSQASVFHYF